ncbi:MAG: hypothetical protein QM817_33680 [Archangium sp.]
MRKLLPLLLIAVAASCTPMRNIKTSSLTFLTQAGATIAVARPQAEVLPAVEQLFSDRGFIVYDRKDVSPTNKVLFMKGNRDRINRRGRSDQYGNNNQPYNPQPTGYDQYGNPTYGNQPPPNGATTSSGAANPAGTQPSTPPSETSAMREQNYVSRDVGSWFAVRAVTENGRTVLTFYGKPTVFNAEGCGDGDSNLRDTGYSCRDLLVRADWPGQQLVEGREETQVISTIIALLGERWPLQ